MIRPSGACREPAADHATRLAWLAGELVGIAGYECADPPTIAEIAVAVADHAHHRGVGTLLIEQLVSAGHDQGVRTRRWVPAGAEVTRPVDTTATVAPDNFRRCLELVAADDGVDAILAWCVKRAPAGYRALAARFSDRMSAALVQPMITGGTEVIIGVVHEAIFGPLVVFGLGGVATDVLADRTARLTR